MPTATVTLTITGHEGTGGAVTLDKTSLTFTTSDWNIFQVVTVSVISYGQLDRLNITASPTGSYAPAELFIYARSASHVGLIVSPTILEVSAGNSAVQRVRLTKRPTATVTVPVTFKNSVGNRLEGLTKDKTRLIFTPKDWNLWQTVRFSLVPVRKLTSC